MDSAAEPPVAYEVQRDGERWWVCPIGGAECCRVSSNIGEWAADAVSWHVRTHHRSWR